MKGFWSVRSLWVLRAVLGPVAVVAVASCAGGDEEATGSAAAGGGPTAEGVSDGEGRLDGVTVEVRRDPGCGCCTSWVEYLQKHGATVELSENADRASFRLALGIGDDAASCHTAVVDGYAIEGHVPVSAIRQLLVTRPDAVGLALPGMPSDSPGMGGDAADWARLPVMLVSAAGELGTFDY